MSILSSDSRCTIFLTGNESGIGLALVSRLQSLGHKVIKAVKHQEHLDAVKCKWPNITPFLANLDTDDGRIDAVRRLVDEFAEVNVLLNISREDKCPLSILDTKGETSDLSFSTDVLESALIAPFHLCTLLIDYLLQQPRGLILNVTSTLACEPMPDYPVFCAAKAGLHSFTQSLRHQLAADNVSNVQVVEIVAPLFENDMVPARAVRHSVSLDMFADDAVRQLMTDCEEIVFYDGKAAASAKEDKTGGKTGGEAQDWDKPGEDNTTKFNKGAGQHQIDHTGKSAKPYHISMV